MTLGFETTTGGTKRKSATGDRRSPMSKEIKTKLRKLEGKKSYSLIAAELNLSRSAVAGALWRMKNPKMNVCGRGRHGSGVYATENLSCKLTPDNVVKIRRDRAAGSRVVDLAGRFGVSTDTIYKVVTRRTWRQVA